MKPDKDKFVETIRKLSYHRHQIEVLPDEDKKYLDMLTRRDNSQFLYEEQPEE